MNILLGSRLVGSPLKDISTLAGLTFALDLVIPGFDILKGQKGIYQIKGIPFSGPVPLLPFKNIVGASTSQEHCRNNRTIGRLVARIDNTAWVGGESKGIEGRGSGRK